MADDPDPEDEIPGIEDNNEVSIQQIDYEPPIMYRSGVRSVQPMRPPIGDSIETDHHRISN
jgi:hypothetical protein